MMKEKALPAGIIRQGKQGYAAQNNLMYEDGKVARYGGTDKADQEHEDAKQALEELGAR